MGRLARLALRAILEAIEGAEDPTRGKAIGDYNADRLLRRGVQRGIEIISEAVRLAIAAHLDLSAADKVARTRMSAKHG
jgi:uncharacterized protein with HEPN domain